MFQIPIKETVCGGIETSRRNMSFYATTPSLSFFFLAPKCRNDPSWTKNALFPGEIADLPNGTYLTHICTGLACSRFRSCQWVSPLKLRGRALTKMFWQAFGQNPFNRAHRDRKANEKGRERRKRMKIERRRKRTEGKIERRRKRTEGND